MKTSRPFDLYQFSTLRFVADEYEIWKSSHLGCRGAAPSNWTLYNKGTGKSYGYDTKRDIFKCFFYQGDAPDFRKANNTDEHFDPED